MRRPRAPARWGKIPRLAPAAPPLASAHRVVRALLLTAGTLSLVAVLALRLYAAVRTIPIRTPWDDSSIRRAARTEAQQETLVSAVARLTLPNPPPVLEGRLNGYQRWLVAGLKLGRRISPGQGELDFQAVNVLLLGLQALTLALFAYWATRDWPLASAFAFLWISAPVVFGMSRWILTENLVLAAGPILSFLAARLLGGEAAASPGSRPLVARLVVAGSLAYGIGLFSAAREYAAPSLLVILGSTIVGLVLERRGPEAAVFASVAACFVVPLVSPLAATLPSTMEKSGQVAFFHPLVEWLPHVSLYTVGPALTVALIVLAAAVAHESIPGSAWSRNGIEATLSGRRRGELTGLRALFWGHVILLAFYLGTIALLRNRVSRVAIMPMLTATGLVLIGIRLSPRVRRALSTTPARMAALALVALSWSVFLYQLLVAFQGGKTYAHAAYRLEFYNHPLHLRPLQSPEDSYVCFDPCPYDEP